MNSHVDPPAVESRAAVGYPASNLAVLMTPDYRRDNPYQELLASALAARGVSVSFPQGYRRVFPLWRQLGGRSASPDVLHLHWISPYSKGKSSVVKFLYTAKLILDVLLVQWAGVRLVWTVHNLIGHDSRHPSIEIFCRRRLARIADEIIVHSEQARDLVSLTYRVATEKISVIPHGHYRDAYGPMISAMEARKALGLSKEGRVFLFFGMIRPYKGVIDLLALWADMPALHQHHTLLIAGDVSDPELRAAVQVAASSTRNVRLILERIADDRVGTLFSAADVVVLPFERALTSGSLVLAQSFGRPVVSPLAPGGCFEPVDGPSSSRSGALLELRQALADAARSSPRSSAADLFEWSSSAAQHHAVYGKAAAGER